MARHVAFQFAMGENNGNPSYLIRSKKGLHGRNLPPGMAKLCQMPNMSDAIVDFALGPRGRFFFTYMSDRGIEFAASDGLWQFLKEEWKGSSVKRITFGANDRFWGVKQWSDQGQTKQTTFRNIARSLSDKTKEIFPSIKTFNNVEVVALGMNDAWVLVVDGVCYCSGIEKELMTAINAAYSAGRRLRNVVLSPVRAEVFFLEYDDGTIEFQLPGDWNHEQINLYAAPEYALTEKDSVSPESDSPSGSSSSLTRFTPQVSSPRPMRPTSPTSPTVTIPSLPRATSPRPTSPTRSSTLPQPMPFHRPTSPARSMSGNSFSGITSISPPISRAFSTSPISQSFSTSPPNPRTFSTGGTTPPSRPVPTRSSSQNSSRSAITHSVNRSGRSGSLSTSGYKNGVPTLAYQFSMGENGGKPSYILKSRRGMQWINLPDALTELIQMENMFPAIHDIALGPEGRFYFTYKSALGMEIKTSHELWPFLNIPWEGAMIDRISFGGGEYFWGLATFNDPDSGRVTQAPFAEVPDTLAKQAGTVWPDPLDASKPRVDFMAVGMDEAWIMGIGKRCYWMNIEENIVKAILNAYAAGKTLRNAVLCPVRPDIYWMEFRDNSVESLLPPDWDIEGITAHLSASNALTTPERSRGPAGTPSAATATANQESITSYPFNGWVESADGSGQWAGVHTLEIPKGPRPGGEDGEDGGCVVM